MEIYRELMLEIGYISQNIIMIIIQVKISKWQESVKFLSS